MHGQTIVKTMPEQIREHRVFLDGRSRAISLPIVVRSAGFSLWGEGASMNRPDCAISALEMVTSGALKYFQNGREYHLAAGDCFLLHTGSKNITATDDTIGFVHKRYIRFSGELFPMVLNNLKLADMDIFRPSAEEQQRFKLLHKQIMRELAGKTDGYENRLSLLAYEALLWAGQNATASGISGPVAACLNHMRLNPGLRFDINLLVKIANTSRAGLFRMFRSQLGDTPIGILRKMRIREATALLTHTTIPLKKIATSVGYASKRNLIDAFKNEMKMTPHEYVMKTGNGKHVSDEL